MCITNVILFQLQLVLNIHKSYTFQHIFCHVFYSTKGDIISAERRLIFKVTQKEVIECTVRLKSIATLYRGYASTSPI